LCIRAKTRLGLDQNSLLRRSKLSLDIAGASALTPDGARRRHSMTLEAVIFGGMGTLAEVAELDRAAWNAAFRTHGIDWHWSWDVYAELMRPGGDRQLAARYAAHLGQLVEADLLDRTHQRQFATMLAGGVPLRPGVARMMNWAARGGVKLALVSRSEVEPVRALLKATARERGGLAFDVAVLREDVSHMAPHPAGMVAALGITAGCFVHIFAAALGVSALMAASSTAFTVA
jgi:beta-phosphoglucomutase-like phosphatase (HAD superfamily)